LDIQENRGSIPGRGERSFLHSDQNGYEANLASRLRDAVVVVVVVALSFRSLHDHPS
jgi:hypothetical protein